MSINNTCKTVFFLHVFLKIVLGFECCSAVWSDWCCPNLHQICPVTLLSGEPDTCLQKGHQSWKPDLSWFKLWQSFSECATCKFVISNKPKDLQNVQALYGNDKTDYKYIL